MKVTMSMSLHPLHTVRTQLFTVWYSPDNRVSHVLHSYNRSSNIHIILADAIEELLYSKSTDLADLNLPVKEVRFQNEPVFRKRSCILSNHFLFDKRLLEKHVAHRCLAKMTLQSVGPYVKYIFTISLFEYSIIIVSNRNDHRTVSEMLDAYCFYPENRTNRSVKYYGSIYIIVSNVTNDDIDNSKRMGRISYA